MVWCSCFCGIVFFFPLPCCLAVSTAFFFGGVGEAFSSFFGVGRWLPFHFCVVFVCHSLSLSVLLASRCPLLLALIYIYIYIYFFFAPLSCSLLFCCSDSFSFHYVATIAEVIEEKKVQEAKSRRRNVENQVAAFLSPHLAFSCSDDDERLTLV